MKIGWLSNVFNSLKNCHKQFGQAFRCPNSVLDHNGTSKHKNICFIFTNELVTTFHCQIVHKRVFTKKGDLNPQKGSLGDPGTQLAAVLIVSTA